MSYFIFGLIDPSANCLINDAKDIEILKASARVEGLSPKFGDEIEPGVVREMMNSKTELRSFPFLLTRLPSEDTSDALISPFVLSDRQMRANLGAIGKWLKAMLSGSSVERVRIWMTEGFDVAFERIDVGADEFGDEVGRRFNRTGDMPSLCVFIC